MLGAFTTGGNSQGAIIDHQDHYELQNYTSLVHGTHIFKFGGRLRAIRDASFSQSGFNGTFIFSSLDSAQDTPSNPNCDIAANPATPCPISYQFAVQQLATPGGTPYATQLSFTSGLPNANVTTYDAGLYAQDDWRLRPNITLSAGLRFETQNDIHDHGDWAPRLGIAWGIGGKSAPPKVVLRGGFGIFYDRFQSEQLLQVERLNGITQQQFVINNPTCFPGIGMPLVLSTCGASSVATPTIYQIDPGLHAPYTLQSAISAERQLTKSATLSVTYLNSRGFDQLLTINANAPFPGTPGSTTRPQPGEGNIYRYVSEGNFKQNQLIVNSNVRAGNQGPGVRLLHAELRQQRYFRGFRFSFKFLQHQPGLRPGIIRHAPPPFFWRHDCLALCVSPEPVHDRELRVALQHYVAERFERRFGVQ